MYVLSRFYLKCISICLCVFTLAPAQVFAQRFQAVTTNTSDGSYSPTPFNQNFEFGPGELRVITNGVNKALLIQGASDPTSNAGFASFRFNLPSNPVEGSPNIGIFAANDNASPNNFSFYRMRSLGPFQHNDTPDVFPEPGDECISDFGMSSSPGGVVELSLAWVRTIVGYYFYTFLDINEGENIAMSKCLVTSADFGAEPITGLWFMNAEGTTISDVSFVRFKRSELEASADTNVLVLGNVESTPLNAILHTATSTESVASHSNTTVETSPAGIIAFNQVERRLIALTEGTAIVTVTHNRPDEVPAIDTFTIVVSSEANAACGNGAIEETLGETCDDGNTSGGDGCSTNCQLEDNFICTGEPSQCIEQTVCSDGLDNDGDGFTDFPEDEGCTSVFDDAEETQCQDGVDNDNDNLVDLADSECTSVQDISESTQVTYYLDAVNGSDQNDCSSQNPCRSLERGKAVANSPGAIVLLRDGTYGTFSESSSPGLSDYRTFRAQDGHHPRLSGIRVIYPNPASAKLIFENLEIVSERGTDVVILDAAHDIVLRGNIITSKEHTIYHPVNYPGNPDARQSARGFDIDDSHNVLIERNKIGYQLPGFPRSTVHDGGDFVGNDGLIIRNNYIKVGDGTGLRMRGNENGGDNSGAIVEYNHLTRSTVAKYPEDPESAVSPHASIMSIRQSDLTIRGNVGHGFGNSSGIMFYGPDAAGGKNSYDNILIELNLLYAVRNAYVLRMYNAGQNVVVRNNYLQNRLRSGDCPDGGIGDARYRYGFTWLVHNEATTGSSITAVNNLFGGVIGAPGGVFERNNIIWSWAGSPWRSTSPSGTSEILTDSYSGCGNHSTDFESVGQPSSIFANPIDFRFLGSQIVNFSYAANSRARTFADPSRAPNHPGIAGIDAEGFVITGPRDPMEVGPFAASY